MHYVYILYSSSAVKYYIGFTDDVERRLEEHNSIRSTHYTNRYQPWTLVYKEKYVDKTLAIKREKYLKRMKSKKYIEKLIEQSRL